MDVMTLPLSTRINIGLPLSIGSFCVLDSRLSAKPSGWAGKECRLGGGGYGLVCGEVAAAGCFSGLRVKSFRKLRSQFCRQWLPFEAAIAVHFRRQMANGQRNCAEVEGSTVTA
jgi:hypothetical protein